MCDSVTGYPVTESHVCQWAFKAGKTHFLKTQFSYDLKKILGTIIFMTMLF